jgi:general secretion pathway protein M
MRAVHPERERWYALGILVAATMLAYLVLVHPWWTVPMLQLQDRIDTLQQRELRARMELRQAPEVRQRLDAVQAQAARIPGFMSEPSPELATAALVQRLETAVAEASPGNRSCAIVTRSPIVEPRQQRFPRAIVNVRLQCGSPELAAVLYSLENGSPRLFVDNLNILMYRTYLPMRPGGTTGESAGLDATFDLYGYLRPQAGANNAR